MDAPYYMADDNRDELTQPEPTLCLPCDDAGRETPATTAIDRGPSRIPLPACEACRQAYARHGYAGLAAASGPEAA
jgi:hypothetical protein